MDLEDCLILLLVCLFAYTTHLALVGLIASSDTRALLITLLWGIAEAV